MEAIIIAGGFGVRLKKLGLNLPKPLIKLGKKTVLDHILAKIERISRIENTIITINRRHESMFIEWLEKRDYRNVAFRVEEAGSAEEKPGAIKALASVITTIGESSYLVVAGDNFFTSDLQRLIDFYESRNGPVVALHDVKDHTLVKELSSVMIDSGSRIIDFEEKPKEPKTTLVGTGIYVFDRNSKSSLEKYLGENNNPDNLGHFLAWLCKRTSVYGYTLDGRWWDIGTPSSYSDAKSFIENI